VLCGCGYGIEVMNDIVLQIIGGVLGLTVGSALVVIFWLVKLHHE
jgi:hypothetical protein